jgi:GT2 family glycosyltransferase
MKRIYVVILNWNGLKDTVECLESLAPILQPNVRVVVCDNGSTDGSLSRLGEWFDRQYRHEWRLIKAADIGVLAGIDMHARAILVDNGANLGFAGGNNVGVRLAMTDADCYYVWVLNNDTVVDPSALSEVIKVAEGDSAIGICGSTLVYHHDRSLVQALGGAIYSPLSGRARHIGAFTSPADAEARSATASGEMSYVVGAAMLVTRRYLEEVGLMREDYFLYCEEIDWAYRGRGKFCLGYAPKSIVYHKEGATIGTSSGGGSPLSMFFLYRNRVWFSARFHPLFLPTVLACCLYDVLKLAVKGRWKLVRAALSGMCFRTPPIPVRGRG